MLAATVLTSLLAGFVAAQNTTNFDANSVDLTTKNQWCQGETANCPLLCGGQANTQMNQCTGSNLQYTCTCANGSKPADIDQYQGTLPNFICEATFAQCRTQNPGSSACQTCGTLQATNVPTASPSSSATSSAAPTSSGTATASAAGTTASKAAAMDNARPVGGAAVVGGVVAALLL